MFNRIVYMLFLMMIMSFSSLQAAQDPSLQAHDSRKEERVVKGREVEWFYDNEDEEFGVRVVLNTEDSSVAQSNQGKNKPMMVRDALPLLPYSVFLEDGSHIAFEIKAKRQKNPMGFAFNIYMEGHQESIIEHGYCIDTSKNRSDERNNGQDEYFYSSLGRYQNLEKTIKASNLKPKKDISTEEKNNRFMCHIEIGELQSFQGIDIPDGTKEGSVYVLSENDSIPLSQNVPSTENVFSWKPIIGGAVIGGVVVLGGWYVYATYWAAPVIAKILVETTTVVSGWGMAATAGGAVAGGGVGAATQAGVKRTQLNDQAGIFPGNKSETDFVRISYPHSSRNFKRTREFIIGFYSHM